MTIFRRIGLKVLLMVGGSPRLVLLGFMLPTAILSMWISNTASTAMMIPILEVGAFYLFMWISNKKALQ